MRERMHVFWLRVQRIAFFDSPCYAKGAVGGKVRRLSGGQPPYYLANQGAILISAPGKGVRQ